jgi:hypothetical protein
MADEPYALRKEDLLMVEWLLIHLTTLYESLCAYTAELQQAISTIIGNQFLLWMVVVLFILVLRWLTQSRSDMI